MLASDSWYIVVLFRLESLVADSISYIYSFNLNKGWPATQWIDFQTEIRVDGAELCLAIMRRFVEIHE
jgi:hypothetical protein